ncbi:MAG: haloacid dehalogenase type II [Myxococcales bacterium]
MKAVLLDLFGTTFQLEPLGKHLEAAGVPASSLKLWFARILRDAWALEVAGQYRPFREVAGAALEVLVVELGGTPDRAEMGQVLDAFASLPPYPDVKPALEQLRARGVVVASLGNGSKEVADKLFENAGLSALVEPRISIDEVKHWKPHAAAYQHAVARLGFAPAEVTLLAAHAWDVQGARRAGLRGAWVGRLERKFQPAMGEPDLAAESFAGLVDKL